jgi:hypothetical protein
MQTVGTLLTVDPNIGQYFTKLEVLAALISGAIHDVDHPVRYF